MRAKKGRLGRLRLAVGAFAAAALTIGLAVPASAADVTPTSNGDAVVVLSGRVIVGAEEHVGDVVVFDGPITVFGHVDGSVVALNGPITIAAGSVSDNVTAVNGRIHIQAGSYVGGDVLSRFRTQTSPDATVEGTIERFSFDAWPALGLVAGAVWWLAVTLSLLIIGELLIAFLPKLANRVQNAITSATALSVGLGFAVVIGVPLVAVAALLTLVGIPLGLFLLLAVAVLIPVAYVIGALLLGQVIARKATPAVAFLVGFGILRVLAAIPFVDGLAWGAASIIGIGALTLAAWRMAHPAARPEPVPRFAGGAALPN